jgi:hypothetical protein
MHGIVIAVCVAAGACAHVATIVAPRVGKQQLVAVVIAIDMASVS